jgi:hypothetical protein
MRTRLSHEKDLEKPTTKLSGRKLGNTPKNTFFRRLDMLVTGWRNRAQLCTCVTVTASGRQFNILTHRMSSTIVWTQSNIIFVAHPTQPHLHSELLNPDPRPSPAKRFSLPLPPVVLASQAFFAPPVSLSLSDDDAHLFAFLPPSSLGLEDGDCCVWERGNSLTSWDVKELWRTDRGNDVIASRWIESRRKVSFCLIWPTLSWPHLIGLSCRA